MLFFGLFFLQTNTSQFWRDKELTLKFNLKLGARTVKHGTHTSHVKCRTLFCKINIVVLLNKKSLWAAFRINHLGSGLSTWNTYPSCQVEDAFCSLMSRGQGSKSHYHFLGKPCRRDTRARTVKRHANGG